jgi:maltose alpha-D-glucosyltransferase / alpha-amylase
MLRRLRHQYGPAAVSSGVHPAGRDWVQRQAVAYFGDAAKGGDECHMAFHFPLMPRLFMALRLEDKAPIEWILRATPSIPQSSQWATFLRNHDELTLEMVTEAERSFMLQEYARHPRARLNLGIRRRLLPLLDNSLSEAQLLQALLVSLPGSPVLYYGDEIGTGDNLLLNDRDGVRTPMQWSAACNAGFSHASSASLSLPVVAEPRYGYATVNVESQLADPQSLLHWTQRLLRRRRRIPAMAIGALSLVESDSRSILAYLRTAQTADGEQTVLCVNNFSDRAQAVGLNLVHYAGCGMVDADGGMRFPSIDTDPYRLTLAAYGFIWLLVQTPTQNP